jgi:hypothetical protein
LFEGPAHSGLRNVKHFGDHIIRHNGAMFDMSHFACMIALFAWMLSEHKKFVGLKGLEYLLGGKGLDSLPVDVVCWCQL